MKETLGGIIRIMLGKYQTDISVYDESFLEKSINSRINELSMKDIADYETFLESNYDEHLILKGSLNNTYSEFFRNPLTFLVLEQELLPKLFLQKCSTHPSEIRIWTAGCASGQEAYSIAILFEDYKLINHQDVTTRIFATDSNEKELETAVKGIFNFRSVQNTRLSLINNYFSNSGEYYSIITGIKKNVDFSFFDLLDEGKGAPPASIYGDFDIVMCSNLLFYYKPEIQKRILSRISSSLVPGGFLITGEAEVGIIKSIKGFRQYSSSVSIFIKT